MKKLLLSVLIVLTVILVFGGIYSILQTRKVALDIRQTILNKEDFTGQTKAQIIERFGKPKSFQNLGIVDKNLEGHNIGFLFYPALGIQMTVRLDDGIVTSVEYSQKKRNKKVVTFTINDISVNNGEVTITNPDLLPAK